MVVDFFSMKSELIIEVSGSPWANLSCRGPGEREEKGCDGDAFAHMLVQGCIVQRAGPWPAGARAGSPAE